MSERSATYRKTAPARAIDFETSGLAALSRAYREGGGVSTALLTDRGGDWLETALISQTQPSREDAREFGRLLARTHAFNGGEERLFGQAPDGFLPDGATDGLGYKGESRLPVVGAGTAGFASTPTTLRRNFGEFFAEDRILFYLPQARDNGSVDEAGVAAIRKLAERLRDGEFDSPQPALVETEAALIHGDLWDGNVLWNPAPILIDPACHYGHAETDLSELVIFHAPFVSEIYTGYNEASPLAHGWRERIRLHQLHMIILHAALFGGQYGRQAVNIAREYL